MATYLGSESLKYLLSLIKQKLDLKVDKDGNKTLSTNDYTNDDKNKLSNIPADAQANIIETIVVNNNPLTPDDNKAVNITIPTSTQGIENDSGFITSDALTGYATEKYVDNAVAGVSGGGDVDLTGYLTKTEAEDTYATITTVNGKVDAVSGKGLSSNDYTDTDKTNLDSLVSNGAEANKINSVIVYTTTLSPDTNKAVTIPRAANGTYGCVTTTSSVSSSSGYTPTPIINGIPYYKDTNTDTNTIAQAYCATSGSTTAKTASSTGYKLRSGNRLIVTMVYANTRAGAITLNVNSTGAKTIYINGSISSASNYTLPAGTYFVYYNGSNYYFYTNSEQYGVVSYDVSQSLTDTQKSTVRTNIGAETSGAVLAHNTASDAHNDIRNAIPTLTEIGVDDVTSIWNNTTV